MLRQPVGAPAGAQAAGNAPSGVKAAYPTIKSETEYAKRRAFDGQQARPNKKARKADENAQDHTGALVEEMLERQTTQVAPGVAAAAAAGLHSGPTDFSGLFPKTGAAPLRRDQRGAAPAQHQQQQQQPGVKGGPARTFEHLPSQRQSRQVLGELLPGSSYQLPPALQQAGDATNVTSAAPASAGGDRQLPPSESAPLDWSLKTTVRFSSPAPFAIAEEAAFLSGGDALGVQRAAAAGEGAAGLSMAQHYAAALLSWQFPADPWRTPQPGAVKLRAPPPEVVARRRDWQSALCSLYDALRCGACDAFYYLSPEGSKKPFAVFFGAAGVGGRHRLHALLTRSTGGLRALLNGGLQLGFQAPLLPQDADRRVEMDQSAVPLDGSQSLLVFEGALRVHGLFDFLLNESFKSHGEECDVPTLLAPAQFAHASLCAAQTKVLGISDARDAAKAQHRLELRGAALPPWVIDRLATTLAITQDGAFSMACDTHPLTLALNWHPSSSSEGAAAAAAAGRTGGSRRQVLGVGGGGAAASQPAQLSNFEARRRGCWDGEEAERWRTAAPGLRCNVVRELRCEGGLFTAKLSAKSAERVVL